jgi:hypothetical protein
MAYVNQAGNFGYGVQLTATQMQNLRDNLAATMAKASGAPVLAADYVTSAMIGAGQIGSEHIADDQIGTQHLAADCVTATEIADNAIVRAHIDGDTGVLLGPYGQDHNWLVGVVNVNIITTDGDEMTITTSGVWNVNPVSLVEDLNEGEKKGDWTLSADGTELALDADELFTTEIKAVLSCTCCVTSNYGATFGYVFNQCRGVTSLGALVLKFDNNIIDSLTAGIAINVPITVVGY